MGASVYSISVKCSQLAGHCFLLEPHGDTGMWPGQKGSWQHGWGIWGCGVLRVFSLLGDFHGFSNKEAPHGASAGATNGIFICVEIASSCKGKGLGF